MWVSKVGDIAMGTCVCASNPFPATGVVTSGSAMISTTGIPIAVGNFSIVTFPCGTSTIISPQISLKTAGMSVSKSGDSVVGCGNGTLVSQSQITSL